MEDTKVEDPPEAPIKSYRCAYVRKGVNLLGKIFLYHDRLIFRSPLLKDYTEASFLFKNVDGLMKKGVGGIDVSLKSPAGDVLKFATFPKRDSAFKTLSSFISGSQAEVNGKGSESDDAVTKPLDVPTNSSVSSFLNQAQSVPKSGDESQTPLPPLPLRSLAPKTVGENDAMTWKHDLWKSDMSKLASDGGTLADSVDDDVLSTSSATSRTSSLKQPYRQLDRDIQGAQISPTPSVILMSLVVLIVLVVMIVQATDASRFASNEFTLLRRAAIDSKLLG